MKSLNYGCAHRLRFRAIALTLRARLRLAIGVVAVSSLLLASPAELRFEAASIKPTKFATGVMGGCHGRDAHFRPDDYESAVPLGRCVFQAGRLTHIMAIAFSIDVNRIAVRPDWDGPSRFDLEAKAENPSATQEELLQMLRTLLADRFKLKVARETKQESGYALVIAKNGPKVKPGRQGEEEHLTFRGVRINKLDAIEGKLPLNTITGQNTSIHRIVDALSLAVRAPVVDRTGLTGLYDFTLNWEPDEEVAGPLQQQLGLRLDAQKVPVEYLNIVSAERPTEN
jgi:uncharacterized protein (TIGR03435 family)